MLIIRLILLLAGIVFPLYSFGCDYTSIGSPYSVNYGNIIVQRDVPVGQAISNEIYGSMALGYSCTATGNEGSSAGMNSAGLTYAFTSANGRRVFNTGLPGVGISLGYYEKNTAGPATYMGTTWLAADMFTASWSTNPGENDTYSFQPIIQFWKTVPLPPVLSAVNWRRLSPGKRSIGAGRQRLTFPSMPEQVPSLRWHVLSPRQIWCSPLARSWRAASVAPSALPLRGGK